MNLFTGTRAVAVLTVREAVRQRLWLLYVAVAIGLLVVVPRLQAVDDTARLKLSVAMVTGAIGFLAVLLAALVGPWTIRRDLETRTVYMLFAKPLSALAYLCGRWSGLVVALGIGALLLAAVGAGAIAWRFDGAPAVRRATEASEWEKISAAGEVSHIDASRRRMALNGAPHNALRWRVLDLPSGEDLEVLVRVRINGPDPDEILDQALISVAAIDAVGQAHVLRLDPHSPYGRGDVERKDDVLVARNRDEDRRDLAQDFMRLHLPAALVVDGAVTIQLTRLEAGKALVVSRDGMKVASTAGGFTANLARATLVQLAGAGLLAACALCCATVANLGVCLLATLTLYFAGSALPMIQETIGDQDASAPVLRLLQLASWVLPDFDRHQVAADLAASRAIEWSTVGSAWLSFGVYAAIFLSLAWVALARRET